MKDPVLTTLVDQLNQARIDKKDATQRESIARDKLLEYMEKNNVLSLDGTDVSVTYTQNKPKEVFDEKAFINHLQNTNLDVFAKVTQVEHVLVPELLQELIITGEYEATELLPFTDVKPGNKVLKTEKKK